MSTPDAKSPKSPTPSKSFFFVLALVAGSVIAGMLISQLVVNEPVVAPSSSPPLVLSPSVSPTPSAAPTALAWPTADFTQAFSGSVPPVPLLTNVQVFQGPFGGTEGNFDRISFTFSGARAPGFTVKYVNSVARDGSGAPVSLTGKALLQVVFTPAAGHDDNGNSTVTPSTIEPVTTGFAGIQSYVLNGDFEGYVSVALGTAAKNGFKTSSTSQNNKWVVSVDVARP